MDATCQDLLDYLTSSPTPYHAVEGAIRRLAPLGFTLIEETSSFDQLAAGRYLVKRGDSTLLAFIHQGETPTAFRVVGAHTDSPNLRLKPNAGFEAHGYLQLGVEVYGGALLNSWLDRDLGLAGRLLVRSGGRIETRLVSIDRPLLRVPQLAIHLDREVNDKGLVLNKQQHLAPVLGLSADKKAAEQLLALVAAAAGVEVSSIVSSELMLHDVTRPTAAGLGDELIFSGRLDNLAMCHAGVTALARASEGALPRGVVPVVALFDHEEVGSASAYGAGGTALPSLLERLALSRGGGREAYHRAIAASVCVSADMAHAVHPNYADKHEPRHRPVINGGPVIKINAQQRYATCARTEAMFAELCARAGVPVQRYVVRTDLPCGSTIGPITSTLLGMRTVDVGNPMLSMHSAREMAGSADPAMMVAVLARAFTEESF